MTRHNAPRWHTKNAPHIESFFVKANELTSRRAIWLKVTCLKMSNDSHDAWIDVWCCYFDADRSKFDGGRTRFAYKDCHFTSEDLRFENDTFSIEFRHDGGQFHGQLNGDEGPIEVHLKWQPVDSSLGNPYGMFPFSWMLTTPIPKQKTITPIGLALFDGYFMSGNTRHELHAWYGCQGHNWGQAHTPNYVWLQSLLCQDGEVVGTCEAFSGSVQLGSKRLGPFSAIRIQLPDKTYSFNRLVDTWNQHSRFDENVFNLQISKGTMRAELSSKANLSHVQCLGYEDPNGTMHYCINSKLASLELSLEVNGTTQHFESHHCTALEWLAETPIGRVI